MKLDQLQVGKKYWKSQSRVCSRMRYTDVIGIPVFVMEVDIKNKSVLASANGKPAQWFTGKQISRWKAADPVGGK